MPGVKDPFGSRFHKCLHIHHSGRQCGQRIPNGVDYCQFHGDSARYNCAECDSMRERFIPPKGW